MLLRAFLALVFALTALPALGAEVRLTVERKDVTVTGRSVSAITFNGQLPGPTLRFREGEDVTIHVANKLDEDTSVHWHGLLLPGMMDGVPGLNGYPGIKPGETFTYRFKVRQAGTYWYHSHSGAQEQAGMYGALILDPRESEVVKTEREHIIVLSDFWEEDPDEILRNLKNDHSYYNRGRRTIGDFFRDARRNGLGATMRDRLEWGEMRMDPTDMADVSGYTFRVNGQSPTGNWTGLFRAGEHVRLRFIKACAISYFVVLLREIGVLPELQRVTQTQQAVQPEAGYELRAQDGLVPTVPGGGALTGERWLALQAELQHGSIAALQAECANAMAPLRRSLRALLQYHLGTYTLSTRQLLSELRDFVATPS